MRLAIHPRMPPVTSHRIKFILADIEQVQNEKKPFTLRRIRD